MAGVSAVFGGGIYSPNLLLKKCKNFGEAYKEELQTYGALWSINSPILVPNESDRPRTSGKAGSVSFRKR
jgi:hypothetical protein